MRCPTLTELPPPPPGRAGWPWTEESPQLPDTMPDGSPWPRVSIVTPSYNQAQFIEETIRSVLLQGYPDLEYIIIDGGSTDGSVDIIRKYEPWLAYWVSEEDEGQADAINKGWRLTTGDLLAWLNADDIYYAGTLGQAAAVLRAEPEVGLIYANCGVLDEADRCVDQFTARQFALPDILYSRGFIPQQTAFLTRAAYEHAGGVNPDRHYVMDFELWLRIVTCFPYRYINATWAGFRMSANNKTIAHSDRFWPEIVSVLHADWLTTYLDAEMLRRAQHEALCNAGLELVRVGKFEEGIGMVCQAFARGYPYGNLTNSAFAMLGMLSPKRWRKASIDTPQALLILMARMVSSEHEDGRLLACIWTALAIQFYALGDFLEARAAAWRAMRYSHTACFDQRLWGIALKAPIKWVLSRLLQQRYFQGVL